MPQLEQYLTSTQREQLVAMAVRCQCGQPKSPKYQYCLTCAKAVRHVGPFVVVESPSGNYVETGGLESAESLLERNRVRSLNTPL